MSTKDIWMPIYIGDYLSDTQLLTTEQHGAYFLLIMAYWKNGGPLPDDDRILRGIAKLESKQWKSCREALSEFFQVSGKKWHHKRIDSELNRASDLQQKASERASTAAKIRWERERQKQEMDAPGNASSTAPSNAGAMPEHMQMQCKSQSQSQLPKILPLPEGELISNTGNTVDTTTGEIYEFGGDK